MSHSLQHSFLATFAAVTSAALFIGASIMPAFNLSSTMVI